MSTPPSSGQTSTMLRTIDNLVGPAGRLEALLNLGGADARYSVLLCHPHPLGGGTMHSKVVYHAMKAFQSFGLPVLRFNFRGTGLSEGVHDEGRGEVEDVRAGLAWLEREFRLPILFAGFSFGSNVGLRAACGDTRVQGIACLGLPVHAEGRDYHYNFLPHCSQPKLFLSGDADQYGSKNAVAAIVASAAPPVQLVFVPGADHFFTGKLQQMQLSIRSWVETEFLQPKHAGAAAVSTPLADQ
ncbi:MAG TPA: alpha/beta family hydrolase [Acidobacteriaceae bacterium]